MSKRASIIVVGAGIGGLSTAVALRNANVDVEVYESRPEIRTTGTALGIASNAVRVLTELGIDLSGDGQELLNFEFRTATGELIRKLPIAQMTENLGAPTISIYRNELLDVLAAAAEGIPIHRDWAVDSVSINGKATIVGVDGRTATADGIVGADGIRSTVRAHIAGAAEVREAGYVCWLAVIPFEHRGLARGDALHYWGAGQRFGLIDIGGGRAYWWGTETMPIGQARGTKQEVAAAFAGWAPEVCAAIDQTPDDAIITVPAQDRPFLRRRGAGPVTLVGDAAHPMLTSLSQGAGSAIEDAYVLGRSLSDTTDPATAFRAYERARQRRTRWLVRTSRSVSLMEQISHPVPRTVRDYLLRHLPDSVVRRQYESAMRFDL